MSDWLSFLFEMIKISVPAVIVFLTSYYMLKGFFKSNLQHKQLKIKAEDRKTVLQIRLTAYERLSLFCSRIDIPQLLLRLKNNSMTNMDLKNALLISVQKEFEHNLVQQLYVSEQLWQIIQLSKDEVVSTILNVFGALDPSGPCEELTSKLMEFHSTSAFNPIAKAREAIKKETEYWLS